MAYDQTGIVNLALGKIGVKTITDIDDTDSDQAIRAKAAWDYILGEVLESGDWKFAKTRIALAQTTADPLFHWKYAYFLPSDFLKLALGTKNDPNISPIGYPWVIEAQPTTDRKILLINYDNSSVDLFINYIRNITNPAKYSGVFCGALAFRFAAELAIPLTEGLKKYDAMITLYQRALQLAEGLDQSLDELPDEKGNTDWVNAGRGV